jgi:hypothetical protein
MATKPYKGPPPGRPDGLKSLLLSVWRNPANSHFLAKMERGHFSNIPVRTVEEAVAEARRLSAAGADVYFACAEYASHESRTADNVVAVWDFWLDIDCGEAKAAAGTGHATFAIARGVLSKCCAEIGIPEPTFVLDTGGGLHAHWALQTELDPVKWKSIAEKFKKVMAARGLLQDRSRTADRASVMRLPGTRNHKYDPIRPVTLVESRQYVDTDAFCRAVEEAHAQYCSAPVVAQPRATVTKDQPHGRQDLEKVGSALTVLDPDCEEVKWKFYLAALARAAREHPEDAEAWRTLGMDWSSGALWSTPSTKWTEPGGNGLTGEQAFPEVWDRFLHEEDREGPVITLGTIFHDGQLAGAPPVVIPGDALSLLQQRYGLIIQGGDLYGVRRIDADPRQLFIKERALRRLMRRDLKKRFPDDPGPTIKQFFDSPLTTLYQGVYCHPTEERPEYLNLWRGPVLEPKAGDCTRIKAFLSDVLCDGDPALYDYLIKYLAHLIQRPEEKPGVMIILLGGQGAGKGTFGELLRRIFGDGYLLVEQVERVLGTFNGALERSVVVFLDEACFSGDRRHVQALKSLVTESTVTINEKHQPTRQIQSFHRFVAAANAELLKHTDRDDRRDFVLRVSHRHLGDMEYWQALYAEIDGDGTAAFVHELLQLDISDFNVRQRPITKALREQKLLSEDDVGRWLYQCLHEGVMGGPEAGWPAFVATEDVLGWVEDFAGRRRDRRWSRQEIVRRLTQMCPSIRKAQRAVIQGAARRRGLEWPPPEVARNEFEAYIGHPVDWED